jgi:FkbM family methyltransferase
LNKLRKLRRRILRKIRFLKAGFYPSLLKLPASCPSTLVGSEYGGWHLLPKLIEENSIVYSLGLGRDISFDLGMVQRFSVSVHGFDPTPLSADWIRSQTLPPEFHFHEVGISETDGHMELFVPLQDGFVSHTLTDQGDGQKKVVVPVKRLATIMAELKHEGIDVLKMDIEGCEYQVIQDMVDSGIRPGQLLVEFHHTVLDMGFGPTIAAFETLSKQGYRLFHISDNGNEYSFAHRSSLNEAGIVS